MKKSLLIIVAIVFALGLTALGYLSWNGQTYGDKPLSCNDAENSETDLNLLIVEEANSNFSFEIGSRFYATISKKDLLNATSVVDLVPEDAVSWRSVPFESVKITIMAGDFELSESGNSKNLNEAQTSLLRTVDYSSNFFINAQGAATDPETGHIENYAYYFTVVPEKEARYEGGKNALINYLKHGSYDLTKNVNQDKLRQGAIDFTITEKGTISGIQISSFCGYPEIDERMVQLLEDAPGSWDAAENNSGDKIDQIFRFSFGMIGC